MFSVTHPNRLCYFFKGLRPDCNSVAEYKYRRVSSCHRQISVKTALAPKATLCSVHWTSGLALCRVCSHATVVSHREFCTTQVDFFRTSGTLSFTLHSITSSMNSSGQEKSESPLAQTMTPVMTGTRTFKPVRIDF